MKNILKIIAMMTLSVAVTSSVFSADKKTADVEVQNQEPIGIEMSESEIIAKINEIKAKGDGMTRDDRFERMDLQKKTHKNREY